MECGDYVIHKLSGAKMRIISLSDTVATVENLDEPKELTRLQFWRHPRYVCSLFNLEKIIRIDETQLTLFV
jgi:hypothetical protein